MLVKRQKHLIYKTNISNILNSLHWGKLQSSANILRILYFKTEDLLCTITVISTLQRSVLSVDRHWLRLISSSVKMKKKIPISMISFSLLTRGHLVLRKTIWNNREIYAIYLIQNFKEWNLIISLFWFFIVNNKDFLISSFSVLCGLNVWRWANSGSNEIKADENTADDTVYHRILTTIQYA